MKTINIGDRKLYDIEEEEINEFIEKFTGLEDNLFPYCDSDIFGIEEDGNKVLSKKYSAYYDQERECIIFDIHIPPSGYMEADEAEGSLTFGAFNLSQFGYGNEITLDIINWFIKKGFAVPLESFEK